MFGIQSVLITLSASIALIHTLMGPDHYLPFIAMAKARQWSIVRTFWITVVCGFGHVLSSALLGLLGVSFGIALSKLTFWEAIRGDVAAWILLVFGFTYLVWGVFRAIRNKSHSHSHEHHDGTVHQHDHSHSGGHVHLHEIRGKQDITPWILFTIFVFGPCEPLIPVLMYPAAHGSLLNLLLVTGVFFLVTVGTMTTIVLTAVYGCSFVKMSYLERYGHALAGLTIFLSGFAIKFLGL